MPNLRERRTLQGDPSGRHLHFVDFDRVVTMSALFYLGSCKCGGIFYLTNSSLTYLTYSMSNKTKILTYLTYGMSNKTKIMTNLTN